MCETIPMGDCLGYAHRQALLMITGKTEEGTIYQGLVTAPLSMPSQVYLHAWVNVGGIVQDWQMMEGGQGGDKFNGKGMPEELFNELLDKKFIYETKGFVYIFSDVRFIKFNPYYIIEKLVERYRKQEISLNEYLTHLKLLSEQTRDKLSIDYEIV